jgi:hypothetical protein
MNALAVACLFVCAGLDAHSVGVEAPDYCVCFDGVEKFSVPVDPCGCSTTAPLTAARQEEPHGSPQEASSEGVRGLLPDVRAAEVRRRPAL